MTDYAPDAVRARLEEVARVVDLRPAARLRGKVDYSDAGVASRLRQVEQARRLCLALGNARDPERP